MSNLITLPVPATLFEFGGKPIRTAGTFEAPLFCAADVCDVLAYGDVSQACERLDQDEVEQIGAEKGSRRILYAGINANMYVTESGLFSLILGSNKTEAKAFKKWVTGTVLPEIRKRGFFSLIESQNAKRTELLLAECFPNLPTKAGPIFRELISALLRLRGETGSGNPPWARSLASTVYEWAIHVDGQQAFRRSKNEKPNGAHVDHSMFSDLTIEAVKRVAQAGCDYAQVSVDWADWKMKMGVLFDKHPLQLTMQDQDRRLLLAEKKANRTKKRSA